MNWCNWFLWLGVVWSLLISPMASLAGENPGDDRVLVVSWFYEGYLNGKAYESSKKEAAYLEKVPLFSKGFSDLLAKHKELCRLSRGDDICGFSADEDVFLKTQEIAPDLDYNKSRFQAVFISPDVVEASFTVWPGAKNDYGRILRFKMVKEDGGWRVDDFGAKSDNGSFQMARQDILAENDFIMEQAKDLKDSWSWVKLYLGDPDYQKRAPRFFSSPVEILEAGGKKRSINPDDKNLAEIIRKLGEQSFLKEDDKKFGKKESEHPKDGDEVIKGPLVFRFQSSAWWIVKVDLSLLKEAKPKK
ncbi:MAG: hypothetical protein HQM08_30330 [Candidatus Riflebacteria bacterium]|nr:hypothetical protein [Candidatus Riflebacteria bacterium]